jgi:predicted nucleic acid-binding protein
VAAGARIAAHARLETYSVLTRMPASHRPPSGAVADALDRRFPHEHTIVPSDSLASSIVRRCSERAVDGGAVYDGLVALTAAEVGLTLVTLDARAVRTYRRLDVAFKLLL